MRVRPRVYAAAAAAAKGLELAGGGAGVWVGGRRVQFGLGLAGVGTWGGVGWRIFSFWV